MKVHDIIEQSVEWVAYDGVLGTEPYALQQYLAKSDPSIDDDYFAYIYTLLVRHPSIRVSISRVPLAAQDKTVRLGLAPLPDDYEAPVAVREDVDITKMYRQGVKGRALAYHLFGEESKTSSEVAAAKRAEHEKNRLKGGKAVKPKPTKKDKQVLKEAEEQLIRDIKAEDGGGIARTDLDGLAVQWGSRLRLRCTDDEIYFRLTGSRVKNSKITPIVFETLQHSVKSRERGITTVELGPLVGTSQGSMHHYMKTLTGLGLCAKVPTVLHAAITNLLVFHKFLDQNDHYRAHTEGQQMIRPAVAPVAPELDSIDADDERADNDTSVSAGPANPNEWGLTFPTLTETELMTGLVVKDRLLKLLDHPGLTNHLLRAKNLLPLLGWAGDHELRHRRAVPRATRRLILDDLVEFVEIGENKVKCLRLTKYNPDHVPRLKPVSESSDQPVMHNVDDLIQRHSDTLIVRGGCALLQSLSYQIASVIAASGTNGMLILDIREALSGLFRRHVEFYFVRLERLTKPSPHLQHLEYSIVMESYGKERRLRAFSREAYREVMRQNGEIVDDTLHPPVPPQAGHMADISYRQYYQNLPEYWSLMDEMGVPTSGANWHVRGGTGSSRPPKRPHSPIGDDQPISVVETTDEPVATTTMSTPTFASRNSKAKPKKAAKMAGYDLDKQVRGRPRKYIHVVESDGKVNRNIIGQTMPHPDLVPIYVYLRDEDLLVPASEGYSGLGPPPACTPEDIAKGLRPSHFNDYPRVPKSGSKGGPSAQTQTPKDPKQEVGPEAVDVGKDAGEKRPSKKPRKSASKALERIMDMDDRLEDSVEGILGAKMEIAVPTESAAETPRVTQSKLKFARAEDNISGVATARPTPESATSPVVSVPASRAATEDVVTSSSNPETTTPITPNRPVPVAQEPRTQSPKTPNLAADPQTDLPQTDLPRTDFSQTVRAPMLKGDERKAIRLSGASKFTTEPTSETTTMDPVVETVTANTEELPSVPPDHTSLTSPRTSPPVATRNRSPSPDARDAKTRGSDNPLFLPHGEDDVPSTTHHTVGEISTVEKAEIEAITVPLYDARMAELRSTVPIRPSQKVRAGKGRRADLGTIRREAELLKVLQEVAGVREEHDLWKRHQVWTRQYAGTDVPNAPLVGATMDRSVWKRIIESLKDDGRIDYTIASVPTHNLATWNNYKVIWLVDTPEERLKLYQKALANTVKILHIPKDPMISQTLPHMSYSEVKLPSQHPSSTAHHVVSTRAIDKASRTLTGDARRDELCKDPLVVSQLHGRQSGKFMRTQILHRAIRAAIHNPQSRAVLSSDQGAFTINLLHEDLSAGAWYSIVLTHERNEDLIAWLRDPENRKTRLKDLPFEVQVGGRQASRIRVRMRAQVELLIALGILSSAAFCEEPEADITIDASHMASAHFKLMSKAQAPDTLRHLVLHDYAPIYHTAATPAVKIGYLPVRTEQEIEAYWEVQKFASIEIDMSRIPMLLERPPSDSQKVAPVPDTIDLDISSVTAMQQASRWTSDMRLLPIQRSALMDAIDWNRGVNKLATAEDLEAFAWEYALPPELVRETLDHRLEQARIKAAERHEQIAIRTEMHRARRAKAQRALATKLAERQAYSRRQWESRVETACIRLGAEFTPEILAYVSRQGLTALTRGNLTDDKVEEIIRYYASNRYREAVKEQEARVETGEQPVEIPQMILQRPKEHVVKRRLLKPSLTKREKPYRAPGKRYRRKWTPQDDELIVDAEAIIRCRNRDVIGNRGRDAMEQLFPGCMTVTFANRLKKSIDTPEKQSYLHLLERAWYAIWTGLRGTEELPDPEIDSNVDFDLRKHIEVFRRKINKNSLRAQAATMTPGDTVMIPYQQVDLPFDIHILSTGYQWKYSSRPVLSFDCLWQSQSSQEHRMGQIGGISLTSPAYKPIKDTAGQTSLRRGRLRAMLRMIVSTPPAQYEQSAAKRLLVDYDARLAVDPEILSMVQERILVKHASASKTGRFYTFTQTWLSLAQGPFPVDLHKEANAMGARLQESASVDWDLMNDGGDIAALLSSVSDHQVEFDFDIKRFPTVAADQGIFNTRKLSDISFEFEFSARRVPTDRNDVEPPSLTRCPVPRPWIDVPADIVVDHAKLLAMVEQAGPIGITKSQLAAALKIDKPQLATYLAALMSSTEPKVFWAGFDTARLVSTIHWQAWQCPAVSLVQNESGQIVEEGGPVVMCTPRKWVDIWGRRIEDVWTQAVDCAKGWLMSRPGMTERILREKLEHVMDRLEMNDVLQYLLDKRVADRRFVDESQQGVIPPVEAIEVEEEDGIYWQVKPSRLFT